MAVAAAAAAAAEAAAAASAGPGVAAAADQGTKTRQAQWHCNSAMLTMSRRRVQGRSAGEALALQMTSVREPLPQSSVMMQAGSVQTPMNWTMLGWRREDSRRDSCAPTQTSRDAPVRRSRGCSAYYVVQLAPAMLLNQLTSFSRPSNSALRVIGCAISAGAVAGC